MIDRRISNIRFIAMLMIVTCHILQHYGNDWCWWFNIGVQLFFVVSGFVHAKKTISNIFLFYYHKFARILIPYWVFLLMVCVLSYIFVDNFQLGRQHLMTFFCRGTFSGVGHLWFVKYILMCYLVTPLLFNKFIEKWGGVLVFVLPLVVLFINLYFQKFQVMMSLLCYFVGFVFGRNGFVVHEQQKSFIVCLGLGELVISAWYFTNFGIRIPVLGFAMVFYNYLHLLYGITLFVLIYSGGVCCLINDKWLEWSDKYSYDVYLVHHVFALGSLSVLSVFSSYVVGIVLYIVLTLFGSMMLHLLTLRLRESVDAIL